MLYVLIALGVVVALVVLALVLLPSFIDEGQIIALAQEQVRKATGGELTVEGDIELSILPNVVIVLGDTTLDLPPQGEDSGRILASVGSVDIAVSLLSLLMGDTEVGQVTLNDTEVQLFDTQGALATQLNLPEIVADGLNTADSPIALRAQLVLANLEGGEPIVVDMEGAVRIPQSFERVTLDRLQTDVTGALTETIRTTLSGTVLLSPLNATLDLVANLPGGDIDGDLIYAAQASPQIDLTFSSDRLDLDQLTPANTATGDGGPEAAPEDDNGIKPPPVPVPVGPLKDLDMRLAVTADSLLSNGQEITGAQLLLRVVDGVSDLQYLRGVLHEGQLDARMTIDVRKPTIEVDLGGGMNGVNIDSLMTSLGAADTARGRVDINWDIETEGKTPEDLQLGLDGNIKLTSSNVEFLPVSAQAEMCGAIAKINRENLSAQMPDTTKISALAARVEFEDAQAKLEQLDIATLGIGMAGSGIASLRDFNFHMNLKANINEELKQLDPACRVEERYVAVDWPIKCSGNLNGDPASWCRVDTDSIVKQMLENEAKSKLRKETEKLQKKLGKEAGGVLNKLFGN